MNYAASIVAIVIIALSMAGLRLWLERKAQAVPYPYWLAVSIDRLAVIYGDTIYVCDSEGSIREKVPIPAHIAPSQLAWHNEKLLIADWKNDELHFFSSSGNTTIPLRGGPEIKAHLNAVVDESNNAIYITDSQGSRLNAYDGAGNYQRTFANFGLGPGSLVSPKDLRFLNDTLYVGNVMRSGVDVFSTDGKFLRTLVEPKGNLFYVQITDFDVTNDHTVTIECDPLYVNCLIASYDPDGKLLSTMPQETGPMSVGDVALGGNILYVSNAATRRITRHDAATLEDRGPASAELDEIGESDNRTFGNLKLYSRLTLVGMGLCVIPMALLYLRYRKEREESAE